MGIGGSLGIVRWLVGGCEWQLRRSGPPGAHAVLRARVLCRASGRGACFLFITRVRHVAFAFASIRRFADFCGFDIAFRRAVAVVFLRTLLFDHFLSLFLGNLLSTVQRRLRRVDSFRFSPSRLSPPSPCLSWCCRYRRRLPGRSIARSLIGKNGDTKWECRFPMLYPPSPIFCVQTFVLKGAPLFYLSAFAVAVECVCWCSRSGVSWFAGILLLLFFFFFRAGGHSSACIRFAFRALELKLLLCLLLRFFQRSTFRAFTSPFARGSFLPPSFLLASSFPPALLSAPASFWTLSRSDV